MNEVREVCFVYNGVITRKKTGNPGSAQISEMKDKIGEKLDAEFAAGKLLPSILLDDGKYRLPVNCGMLYLKSKAGAEMSVRLDVVLNRAKIQEVKKFLKFLPENTVYTWRFGQIGVHTIGSSY